MYKISRNAMPNGHAKFREEKEKYPCMSERSLS